MLLPVSDRWHHSVINDFDDLHGEEALGGDVVEDDLKLGGSGSPSLP